MAFMIVVASLFTPTSAKAACDISAPIDMTGLAVGGSRNIDVSSCTGVVRWGLYSALGIDTQLYFPINHDYTATNGAVLRLTPGSPNGLDETISYQVTYISSGSSNFGTITTYIASTFNLGCVD